MFAREYFAGHYFAPRYFPQAVGFVPPPIVIGPLPHDDYDQDWRPWWDTARRSVRLEERLQEMRREIGLLPEPVALRVGEAAEKAVKKAIDKLVPIKSTIETEKQAFGLVAAFEREYRTAFRGVLAKARADDALAESFRQEVRARLQAQHEREIRSRLIAKDDEEVLALLGYLV